MLLEYFFAQWPHDRSNSLLLFCAHPRLGPCWSHWGIFFIISTTRTENIFFLLPGTRLEWCVRESVCERERETENSRRFSTHSNLHSLEIFGSIADFSKHLASLIAAQKAVLYTTLTAQSNGDLRAHQDFSSFLCICAFIIVIAQIIKRREVRRRRGKN